MSWCRRSRGGRRVERPRGAAAPADRPDEPGYPPTVLLARRDRLRRIEEAQFKELAGLLAGLKGAREGDQTLLDRTMVLYGTCMGSANAHSNVNLPMLLAGGGFKHVGLVAFDTTKNYPLANLYISVLQRLGIEADKFASSTGTMRGLEPA